MIGKFKSRKLWALVLGAALLTLGTGVGLTEETTKELVQLIVAYIAGQSVVDSVTAYKNEQ